MPYEHNEMKQTPMEKLEEDSKVGFALKKLLPKEREAYEKMFEEVLSKKYGEPIDIAQHIFAEFETKDYKHKLLRNDLTAKNILFSKKLDVMNEEFDQLVGAMVADLIYKQHVLRS